MCVIMASETHRPNDAMMEAGWKQNPWGAGVAWLEPIKKSSKDLQVRWEKGITDVEDVKKVVLGVPKDSPIVVHFRIPTEGLEDVVLTHPFPVSEKAEIDFSGTTRGRVLFHNGGWQTWRPFSLDTAAKTGKTLPEGMLNDSRMMAWAAAIYGLSVLQLINEKTIVLGPDGLQMFGPEKQANNYNSTGWEFDSESKIWFSNDLWEKYMPKKHVPVVTPVASAIPGGGRPISTFRAQHGQPERSNEGVSGRGDVTGQVEEGQKELRSLVQQARQTVVEGSRHLLVDNPILRDHYLQLHGRVVPHIPAPTRKAGFVNTADDDLMLMPEPADNNGMGTALITPHDFSTMADVNPLHVMGTRLVH